MTSKRNEKYCAVPDRNIARVYLPVLSKNSIRSNLDTYKPSSLKARVFKIILLLSPVFLLKFYFKKVTLSDEINNKLNSLSKIIFNIFDFNNVELSYYQGTKGPREKQTVQVTRNNSVIAYIKLAEREDAKKLVLNEYSTFQKFTNKPLESVEVPENVRLEDTGKYSFLYQQAPKNKSGSNYLSQKELLDYVKEISGYNKSSLHINSLISSDSVPYYTHEELYLRDALVQWVSENFGIKDISAHFAHGDFVKWNILRLKDGRPYVFDWEYSSDTFPALFDILHYMIIPSALVQEDEPSKIVSNLLNKRSDNGDFLIKAAEISNLNADEIPVYIALYLWFMIQRGVVVDIKNNKRFETELSINSVFRRMLNYLILSVPVKTTQLNILVSAYACEPNRGSEPGVGWNMVKSVSKNNTAWVLTRLSNKNEIERAIRDEPMKNVYFIYTDLPKWLSFWKKGGRGIRTYYYLWQFSALFKTIMQRKHIKIDIAHHVTFVNDWLFTFLALLPYPYVWGPIGSHPKIPSSLAFDCKQQYKDTMRCWFQSFMRHIDLLFWISMIRADLIVGISDDVFKRSPLRWVKSSRRRIHTAIGIESDLCEELSGSSETKGIEDKLDVVSIGRLIPIKGFHLAIEAFAGYIKNGGNGHLEIIGKGPEKTALIKLIKDLEMQDYITLTDWMDRQSVITRLSKADLFLYPSFESGGIVILEAMLLELPIITSNVGGPGSIIDNNTGFKALSITRNDFVDELTHHLETLSKNRLHNQAMGKRGRGTVINEYDWGRRYKFVDQWYESVNSGEI